MYYVSTKKKLQLLISRNRLRKKRLNNLDLKFSWALKTIFECPSKLFMHISYIHNYHLVSELWHRLYIR